MTKDKSTFYLVRQDSQLQLTITRIEKARVHKTALDRAYAMLPFGTISFMVVEESQIRSFTKDIMDATTHKIGEK